MARHKRDLHPEPRGRLVTKLPPRDFRIRPPLGHMERMRASQSQGEVTDPYTDSPQHGDVPVSPVFHLSPVRVVSPVCTVSPMSAVSPMSVGSPSVTVSVDKPVAAVLPEATKTISEKPLRMVIRLPAIDRALQDKTNCEQTEGELGHLPSTPVSEEDFHKQLARLYANRVSAPPKDNHITYKDTTTILAVARDPERRQALKEILDSAGLTLLTHEEHQQLSQRASSPAEPPKPEEPHPLVVSTTHQEGEPQEVSIHMGGSWGIKLTHYKL